MMTKIVGKYRIRRVDTSNCADNEVVYYGLYSSKWDALIACVTKAQQVSMGREEHPEWGLYPNLDATSGEITGLWVEYGGPYEHGISFIIVNAH